MRYRINLGLLTPSLAQIWTTFKSEDREKSLYYECGKWDGNWDGRSAKSLVVSSNSKKYLDQDEYANNLAMKHSKATRNIILIRHGQYVDTAKSDDQRVLTEIGREQARQTGRRLKELRSSGMMPFSRMVNSTLRRAVETADLIAQEIGDPALPRTADPLLCEGSPCPPEPKVDSWHSEGRYIEDSTRIEAAFRRYFHRARPDQEKDSFEILTCHGNVIRYFLCRALQFPPQGWLRMSIGHASITWIIIRPDGRVVLRCYGDVGHMPPNLITTR